jgi:flavin reductase (DIM6/NTAB) family NADH-FMN oxidoreductase RutF
MLIENFAALARDRAYKLLSSIVIPRPIAFVTTISATGIVNAAPFSAFIILSADPGIVGIQVGGGVGIKDTLANVRSTGEFVVNSVCEDMAQVVQDCASVLPPEISEPQAFGLDLVPSSVVLPPRVKASPINLECRLLREVEFGNAPDRLVAGQVVCAHIADDIVADYKIDPGKWRPLGRIAGRTYCRVNEFITV